MNNAAVNGTKSNFQCGTDTQNRNMRWWFFKAGSNTSVVVHSGFSISDMFRQRFSVDKRVDGRCDLIIDSTQIPDAGTYMCEEPVTRRTSSADLTVLGMLLVAIAFYIVFTSYYFVFKNKRTLFSLHCSNRSSLFNECQFKKHR